MTPFIKKLSYKNTNKWIEKLSKIPWGISEDKWIEYKYNIKGGVSRIVEQEIAIQSRNILSYIKFLIWYLGFQHYQIYEPCHVYNQNKDQVYNKIHTGDW